MSDPDLYSPDPWRREAARIRQQNAQRQNDSKNKPAQNDKWGFGYKPPKSIFDDIAPPKPADPPKPKTPEEIETEGAIIGGLFVAGATAGTLYAAAQLTIHYPFYVATAVALPIWKTLEYGIDKITAYNFPKASGVISAAVTATSLYLGASYINDNFNPEITERKERQYPALAVAFSERGVPYRANGSTREEARIAALRTCQATNSRCLSGSSYDAGEPICLSISFAQRPKIYVETQSRPQNGEEHPLQSACQQTRDPANCMRQRATFCNHSP